jgi:hypothetical protein
MRLNIFLLLLFLFFALFAKAQVVKYSPAEIDNLVYDFVKIIGQDEEGFYLLQSNISFDTDKDHMGFRSRKYKIVYYDNNLSQKWNRTFAKNDNEIPVEAVAYGSNKIILSYSILKNKENEISIYAHTLNTGNELSKDKTLIGDITFTNGSELDKIKVIVSHDKSKYAFIQNEIRKDNTQFLHVVVTDADFKRVANYKVEINYPVRNFYFESWALTDSADFVLLASNYSKEKFSAKRKWTAYKLFVAKQGYKDVIEYNLNTEETYVGGTSLTCDYLNNAIVVAGFYTDKPPGSSGLFTGKLNLESNEPPKIKKQPISDANRAKLENTQSLEMNPYQLLNYNIEKVILRSDGGAVVIAEASYTSEFSYYDYFSQSYIRRLEYHFENVITLSVNADGTIDWNAVLRKNQISTDDYGAYSSFGMLIDSEHINFIYNDDIDRTNTIRLFSVNNKGEYRESIVVKPEERVLIIPKSGKQITENEFVFPCWQRKKMLLVKITL